MTGKNWQIEGRYVEYCSCDHGCPCESMADPTYGDCTGLVAFRIDKGYCEEVQLDDLAVVNGITETRGELADATAMQTYIDRLKRERDATKDKDEMRRIKVVRDHRAFTEARRQTIKRPARLDAPAGCAFRRPDGYQA